MAEKKAAGEAAVLAKIAAMPEPFRADKYLTFGLSDKANHELAEGAPHQLRESAWFLSGLDDATEERLSAIVRKAVS